MTDDCLPALLKVLANVRKAEDMYACKSVHFIPRKIQKDIPNSVIALCEFILSQVPEPPAESSFDTLNVDLHQANRKQLSSNGHVLFQSICKFGLRFSTGFSFSCFNI